MAFFLSSHVFSTWLGVPIESSLGCVLGPKADLWDGTFFGTKETGGACLERGRVSFFIYMSDGARCSLVVFGRSLLDSNP